MDRRAFVVGGMAAVAPRLAGRAQAAQARRTPRIAVVCVLRCGDELRLSGTGAFLDSLAVHGYEAERDFVLDRRFAGISAATVSSVAARLVDRKPDIIVVFDNGAVTRALHQAAPGIPMVAIGVPRSAVSDLVDGAPSISGVTVPYERIIVEQYGLLAEVLHGHPRTGILYNATNADHVQLVATTPGLMALEADRIRAFPIRDVRDTGPAFAAMAAWQAGGVVALYDEAFAGSGVTVEALRHRLPTIGLYAQFARGGALMSYGPSTADVYGQGAALVARLLGGAQGSAVDASRALRLTVNGTTARALGLTIPATLLARADQLIE